MHVGEYKAAVIELFKSGNATDAQWEEMASVVLCASESEWEATEQIDASILEKS